ncbi:MAG: hypothetical protein JNM99_13915 [Verrucomicrobiaceae bacterium]|nr:hypothetical protein [Verrucomicrobiaceae bacterium]
MNNALSWFTVRPIRWCWRFIWSRRMIWTVVCFASLLMLYYQWENWRGAKELAVELQRLVARIGTDNPVELAQGPVSDARNYFSNPLIQSWAKPLALEYVPPSKGMNSDWEMKPGIPGSRAVLYTFPAQAIKPACVVDGEKLVQEGNGLSRLNLEEWVKDRANAGEPIPAGKSPLQELTQSLGDANGLLAKLAVGLDRPYSRMIPSDRELAELETRDPSVFQVNQVRDALDFMRYLDLHLRTAAMNGDADKVRIVTAIMLRIAEAMAGRRLMGSIMSMATHEVTFSALHEALGYGVWTDASLVELTRKLSAMDDLKLLERGLAEETLCVSHLMTYFRERNGSGFAQMLADRLHHHPSRPDLLLDLWARIPPRGWLDASHAFVIREMVFFMGPKSENSWLEGARRSMQLKRDCATQWRTLRPLLGTAVVSNYGDIWGDAAWTLFHRRCVIAGCALERYRLRTGGYPTSLDKAKAELSTLKVSDPARPDQSLCYRRDADGYSLWSVGPDQKDDGGSAEFDWLWRIKHVASPKP